MKQFADFQLAQMLTAGIIGEQQWAAMEALGEQYPDISGHIYIVLQK